jgi:hypothetical protein
MTTRPSPDKRGGAALCCQCGNLRSNGPKMLTRDPNRTCEMDDNPRRWRMTRTIFCPVCEMPTCHAMLCRTDANRDNAESYVYNAASWWKTQQGTEAP